jgi:hypothetical protein
MVIDLEHNEPLNVNVGFSDTLNKFIVFKENAFKHRLKESNNVIKYVISEFARY